MSSVHKKIFKVGVPMEVDPFPTHGKVSEWSALPFLELIHSLFVGEKKNNIAISPSLRQA